MDSRGRSRRLPAYAGAGEAPEQAAALLAPLATSLGGLVLFGAAVAMMLTTLGGEREEMA